jgi:hypothetical protein
LNQLGRINAQAGRKLEQIMQAQVAPPALDLSEERPMHPGLVSQGFLAEPQSFAARANTLAKRLSGWR